MSCLLKVIWYVEWLNGDLKPGHPCSNPVSFPLYNSGFQLAAIIFSLRIKTDVLWTVRHCYVFFILNYPQSVANLQLMHGNLLEFYLISKLQKYIFFEVIATLESDIIPSISSPSCPWLPLDIFLKYLCMRRHGWSIREIILLVRNLLLNFQEIGYSNKQCRN